MGDLPRICLEVRPAGNIWMGQRTNCRDNWEMTNRTITLGLSGIGLVALLLGGWFIGLPIVRFIYLMNRHNTVRETIRFVIPSTPFELQHSRIGNNTITAEYRRDITYLANGVTGKSTPLSIDTCGGYPINCYLIQGDGRTFVHLDDAVSEHLLDLDSQSTYVIARDDSRVYVGQIDGESTSTGWGWSMVNNDPSTRSVTIGGKKATPLDDLTGGAEERYIGRIAGKLDHLRFIPASESPENQIKHLFER